MSYTVVIPTNTRLFGNFGHRLCGSYFVATRSCTYNWAKLLKGGYIGDYIGAYYRGY